MPFKFSSEAVNSRRSLTWNKQILQLRWCIGSRTADNSNGNFTKIHQIVKFWSNYSLHSLTSLPIKPQLCKYARNSTRRYLLSVLPRIVVALWIRPRECSSSYIIWGNFTEKGIQWRDELFDSSFRLVCTRCDKVKKKARNNIQPNFHVQLLFPLSPKEEGKMFCSIFYGRYQVLSVSAFIVRAVTYYR